MKTKYYYVIILKSYDVFITLSKYISSFTYANIEP